MGGSDDSVDTCQGLPRENFCMQRDNLFMSQKLYELNVISQRSNLCDFMIVPSRIKYVSDSKICYTIRLQIHFEMLCSVLF